MKASHRGWYMGHIRLGALPQTRKWREVIALLENDDASTSEIASASFDASQAGLKKAAADAGLIHSFWLLTQVITAAQGKNFIPALRAAGIEVSQSPSLLEITAAFTKAFDAYQQKNRTRSDIGEMAQMAATETIAAFVGRETQSLFGTTPDDIKAAFKQLSSNKQFGMLSREFFSRFTQRYLAYFLSRELSNHVGSGKRFSSINEHTEFKLALEGHCQQAAEIVEKFSGGWFSKTNYFEGEITQEKTAGYIYVALKKLRSELTKRGEAGHEE